MNEHMKRILATILVLTMMLWSLTGCGKGLKILDYVNVTFDGGNGQGTANVSIDYDKMELEMVGGQDKVDNLGLQELTKYINCVSSLSFDIDKNKDLSNGDKVTVTVQWDQAAMDSAGVEVDPENSRTYKVKGLQ